MKFISVHRIAGFFRPLTIAVLVLLGIVIIPKFINESKNNSLEVRHPGILRLTEEFAPYLNPNHPNVVKYEKKGNYEIFSLDLTSETPSKEIDALGQTSCDGYGYSACANIITKHGKVIFETVSDFFAHEDNFWEAEAMIGSFQTFTKNGVTFAYLMGEGGPCGRGMTTFLTYYHLPTGKMLYGLYYERER